MTCESTCDTLTSSAVSVAQGGTATPGAKCIYKDTMNAIT